MAPRKCKKNGPAKGAIKKTPPAKAGSPRKIKNISQKKDLAENTPNETSPAKSMPTDLPNNGKNQAKNTFTESLQQSDTSEDEEPVAQQKKSAPSNSKNDNATEPSQESDTSEDEEPVPPQKKAARAKPKPRRVVKKSMSEVEPIPKKKTAAGSPKLKHEGMWRYLDILIGPIPEAEVSLLNVEILKTVRDFMAKKKW